MNFMKIKNIIFLLLLIAAIDISCKDFNGTISILYNKNNEIIFKPSKKNILPKFIINLPEISDVCLKVKIRLDYIYDDYTLVNWKSKHVLAPPQLPRRIFEGPTVEGIPCEVCEPNQYEIYLPMSMFLTDSQEINEHYIQNNIIILHKKDKFTDFGSEQNPYNRTPRTEFDTWNLRIEESFIDKLKEGYPEFLTKINSKNQDCCIVQ